MKENAQLLIFIRGIDDNFEITEEFLTMESLKGTQGEDLAWQRVGGHREAQATLDYTCQRYHIVLQKLTEKTLGCSNK